MGRLSAPQCGRGCAVRVGLRLGSQGASLELKLRSRVKVVQAVGCNRTSIGLGLEAHGGRRSGSERTSGSNFNDFRRRLDLAGGKGRGSCSLSRGHSRNNRHNSTSSKLSRHYSGGDSVRSVLVDHGDRNIGVRGSGGNYDMRKMIFIFASTNKNIYSQSDLRW